MQGENRGWISSRYLDMCLGAVLYMADVHTLMHSITHN